MDPARHFFTRIVTRFFIWKILKNPDFLTRLNFAYYILIFQFFF